MATYHYDISTGIATGTKKYVELTQNADGTSFNVNNFIYHMPRTVNQLCRLIGNDIVIKGMDVTATPNPSQNNIVFAVEPGIAIQDVTLLDSKNTIEVTLNNAGSYDVDGHFVVYIDFQYLQTVSENLVKFGVKHIDQHGNSYDGWDHNKHRIVLAAYDITNLDFSETLGSSTEFYFEEGSVDVDVDETLIDNFSVGDYIYASDDTTSEALIISEVDLVSNKLVLASPYVGSTTGWTSKSTTAVRYIPDSIETVTHIDSSTISIHDKLYTMYGYDIDNIHLYRYISWFSSMLGGGGSGGDLVVPEDLTIGDDLEVNGDLLVHGQSTFEGSISSNDITINGNINASDSTANFHIDSNSVEFGDKILELNRNESGAGISDTGIGGVEINRGTEPAARIWFDESTDKWYAGIVGQTAIEIGSGEGGGGSGSLITHDQISDWFTAFSDGFLYEWNLRTTDDLPEGSTNKYWTTERGYQMMLTRLIAGSGIQLQEVSDNFEISTDISGIIPPATISEIGGVIVGDGLNVAGDGTISVENIFSIADKSKLDAIEDAANNYIHPSTHPASMIIEDDTHRFVSDGEKSIWNAKIDGPTITDIIHGDLGGGTLHPTATDVLNGFMSQFDKQQHDELWVQYQAGNFGGTIVPATTTTIGGVIVGNYLTVDPSGYISVLQDADHNFVTQTQITDWNNKVELDANYLIPKQLISDYFVDTISDRDTLTDMYPGSIAYVFDASDDPNVKVGAASYNYRDSTATWELQFKQINGSYSYLDPVVDITARDAIDTSAFFGGEQVLVLDEGDGSPAQFAWDNVGSSWIKIADPGGTSSYTHPSDGGGSIDTALTGATVIDSISVNSLGHVTSTSTRDLTPADIGAATDTHDHSGTYEPVDATILREADLTGTGSATTPARSDHDHDIVYYTKTELQATGGSADKIDWSHIANTPSIGGSDKWLDPVANITARDAIDTSSFTGGEMVLVQDDGDGKAAQYVWNTSSWVKIADVDFSAYTHPSHPGDDISIDTTGAQIIDVLTISTDTEGHVTNASASTRDLTPADIGAATDTHNHSGTYEPVDATILREADLTGTGSATTPARSDHDHGASTAGNSKYFGTDSAGSVGFYDLPSGSSYTHPSDGGGSIDTALTGATVIDSISVNSLGHVTSTSTRDLTPADIGAATDTHDHSGTYEPVDATILREADLTGTGSATTPARSDHDHGASTAGNSKYFGTDSAGSVGFYDLPSGSSGNAFTTISVSGQNDIVADQTTDTLTLIAGTDIEIITNDTNDEITINSTASGGTGTTGDYNNTIDLIELSATENNVYYLSGVKHMTNGDVFNVDVSGLSTSADITINATQLINSITPQDIASASLNGSGPYNYTFSHTISGLTDTYIKKTNEFVEVRYANWKPWYWRRTSSDKGILIDTHAQTSTSRGILYARDETGRYNSDWSPWDSTLPLLPSDLMVHSGSIQRQFGDWNNVIPNNDTRLNYSVPTNESQWYYFGLHQENTPYDEYQNFMIRVIGTSDGSTPLAWTDVESLTMTDNKVLIWIQAPDSNNWRNIFVPWTGGAPDTGCRFGNSTTPADWVQITLGPDYTSSTSGPDSGHYGVWAKIEIPANSKATIEKVEIDPSSWT